MDKLSEKLEAHAKRAASRAHWAEVGGEDSDGFWTAFAADLDAAAELARRVESSEAGVVEYNFGCCLSVRAESCQWLPIQGKRVRLVREE